MAMQTQVRTGPGQRPLPAPNVPLIVLFLAFILPVGLSRNLLRAANFFNSVGLVALCEPHLVEATRWETPSRR